MTIEMNQIYNMDCMEGMKDIPDGSVDMILTDIPYGVVNRKSNGIRNLDKLKADNITFNIIRFLNECIRAVNGSMYFFCASEQVSEIRKTLVDTGWTTRHCIWRKTNPSPMNGEYLWLNSIENCIFARRSGAVFNARCQGSVWDFPCGRSKTHPTEKPIKLFQMLIETSTNIGMTVLDPCMGSGTTAIACLSTGRKYMGFEIDKDYYEAAQERIAAYSSQMRMEIL